VIGARVYRADCVHSASNVTSAAPERQPRESGHDIQEYVDAVIRHLCRLTRGEAGDDGLKAPLLDLYVAY
jgi:hypothetical protein